MRYGKRRLARGTVAAAFVALTFGATCLAGAAENPGPAVSRPEVDATARELERALARGMRVWTPFEKDWSNAGTVAASLQSTREQVEALLVRLDSIDPAAARPAEKGMVEIRRREVEDLGRAISNALFVLTTFARFYETFGPQTLKIGEATDQLKAAKRLLEESDALAAAYRTGGGHGSLAPRAISDNSRFVFVILIDTLRADHVGVYGYARKTTPNIDRLAAEGLMFEHAFSQASVTNTSVASLLTSLYRTTHKLLGKAGWLWDRSLVTHLRDAGFATGAFSANLLISKDEHFDHGFDHFEELFWCRSTVVLGQAMRWFERARSRRDKIFLYIHLMDPHDLYFPPQPFLSEFSPSASFRVAAYWLDHMIDDRFRQLGERYPDCAYDPEREHWGERGRMLRCVSRLDPDVDVTMQDLTSMIDRYDGEIAYADHEIGRLIDFLRGSGALEKSTIVILADHGEAFLEHNRLRHGRELYDSTIHVPLVFWQGANRLGGRRIAEPVELIDTLPTLFRLVGVGVPQSVQGVDLLDHRLDPDRATYSLTWNGSGVMSGASHELHTVREAGYKYIRTYDRESGTFVRDEFYDLRKDPAEYRDAREAERTRFEALKRRLDAWVASTDAPAPASMERPLTEPQKERLRALGYID